jgi:hypothetical protein
MADPNFPCNLFSSEGNGPLLSQTHLPLEKIPNFPDDDFGFTVSSEGNGFLPRQNQPPPAKIFNIPKLGGDHAPQALRMCPMSSNDKHRNKRKTLISSESKPNSRTLPRIMLDSGADTACVSKQEFLTEVYTCKPWPVLGVTGKTYIKKRGTLTFYSANDQYVRRIVLQHVPIIPESPHDIIAGQSLLEPPDSVISRVGTTKRITDRFNDTIVTVLHRTTTTNFRQIFRNSKENQKI